MKYLVMISCVLFIAVLISSVGKGSDLRLNRMKQSKNFKDGKFVNLVPTTVSEPGTFFKSLKQFFCTEEELVPFSPVPTVKIDKNKLIDKSGKLKIYWIGHSTTLITLDGMIILTDPIFSGSASSFPFAPKRFHKTLPITIEEIPNVDIVIISHDHYDHLDHESIKRLNNKTGVFYAPLGVGAHLEKWGIDPQRIVELDWWEEATHNNRLKLVATPARHFSGRGILDTDLTLWASWVIIGKKRRIYFGGDSGYYKTFKEIGKKYGPFDITMLEMGAYNVNWPTIHLNPEEACRAHLDLRGKLLLPIHWGTFNLSTHSWREPIERLLPEAEKQGIRVATPVAGEPIIYGKTIPGSRWWEKRPVAPALDDDINEAALK